MNYQTNEQLFAMKLHAMKQEYKRQQELPASIRRRELSLYIQDKWIVSLCDRDYADEEILEAIHFQEKYFEGELLR